VCDYYRTIKVPERFYLASLFLEGLTSYKTVQLCKDLQRGLSLPVTISGSFNYETPMQRLLSGVCSTVLYA